jgi:hypothetical protein
LLKNEAISIPNIFIRCSSHGLFAGGGKEIRRVYCTGSLLIEEQNDERSVATEDEQRIISW